MKAAKKSHKRVHKAHRHKSHKNKRSGNKNRKIVEPVELSPIQQQGSPNNLEDSQNSIHFDDSIDQGSVQSFSNVASQLHSQSEPSSINTTVESMEVQHPSGNDDTMDVAELEGPSPANSSTNTTRDRSSGGSKKRKRASRRKHHVKKK